MSGQAVVTINEDQWNVWVASTYTELTTGLSGVASLAAGTGMLFILGAKRQVTVDTSKMLFPLDIIFISDNIIIDVASNIQPGYLVTEETPSDMFLEVNAGEAAGVDAGDTVSVEQLFTILDNVTPVISFAIPLAALGFVSAMVGGMAGLMGGGSSSPTKQLSSPWKADIRLTSDELEILSDDAVAEQFEQQTLPRLLKDSGVPYAEVGKWGDFVHIEGKGYQPSRRELRDIVARAIKKAEAESHHPNQGDYKELPWYRSFEEVRTAVERGSQQDKETLGLVACLMEESEPSPKRIELVRKIEAKLHARGIETERPLTEREIQRIGFAEGLLESATLTLFMPRERLKELLADSEKTEHRSMWLTPEQRKELEGKYGSVAVRWAEEATRPGDVKAAERAAEYYYKKIKEAFGLGHLSPELTEEQIRKLRETLGLPKEVPPREKGYIE